MNEARLREEIRRLVNEQRQLNRRLQQQQLHASAAAFPPSSGGGSGAGSDSGSGSGVRSSNSSQEQPSGTLLQQQQHRTVGEGSGGAGDTAASSFFTRAKPGSYSFLASSSGSNRRGERPNRRDLPFGVAAGADSSCPPSTAVAGAGGSACNLAARALVTERLLAMGASPGEILQSKRPLTPGERPIYDFQGPEFQVEKRPKVMVADEKTVTRDRRMFGALAGHLRRAQQQLQREQGTDVAHKHKQQEERVAQKLALSQKNIAEIARLEWEGRWRRRKLQEKERRQQERLRLEEVSMELVNKENELMRVHLVKHYKNMERFIGTEAQPTLFWLPAKWDDATRRLQEQTRLWIQTKIDHIQSTDYTYRPQQACNGTASGAAEEEGACSSAAVEGGERGTAAAGNSKAAEAPTEAADSKGREVRGLRENSAVVSANTSSAGAAVADTVTPASSISPSTDSSTNAAVAVEGDAAERQGVRSSGVARSRAASKDAAAVTADAAHAGEGESGAVETVGVGGGGDTTVPEHEEDKTLARTGSSGLRRDAAAGADETSGKNHVETATRNGSCFRKGAQ